MKQKEDIYTADFSDIILFEDNTYCFRIECKADLSKVKHEVIEFASVAWITFMMEVHNES